jgi:hypothetical protein
MNLQDREHLFRFHLTVKNTPVFTFDIDDETTDSLAMNIANLIIDGTGEPVENLHIEDDCDLYQGDLCLGSFRGWGHLTSPVCCGLSCEDACKVQNNLIEYSMQRISAEKAQETAENR